MKLQYFLCVVLCSVFSTYGQSPISLSVHFENNALRPNKQELAKLDSLLKSLPDDTLIKAELKAYCDAPGSNAYNRELGNMRLHFVRRQLHPYLADSLIIGENYADKGLQDSARNDAIRRVDLRLYFKPKPATGPGIETLLAQLRPAPQIFEISNDRDTALLCAQGTIIYIPADAFIGARYNQKLRIEVLEIRKKSDMILEGLTTTSNHEILASDGMIKIGVFQENRKLKLARNTSLVISMPQLNPLDNAQLFDGIHGKGKGSSLNWRLSRGTSFNFFGDVNCGLGSSVNEDCPFFWCRLRNFFMGSIPPRYGCHWLNNFFEEYGVDNIPDLIKVINERQPAGEQISTAEEALQIVYQKRREEIEASMANGRFSQAGLSDYLFNTGSLSWINIDSFSRYPRNQLVTQKIKCPKAHRVNMQIVFKSQNSVLPPNSYRNDTFTFKDVPRDEPVIAVALKYVGGKAYIAISEFKIGEKPELNFEIATVESIKESLKVLDA